MITGPSPKIYEVRDILCAETRMEGPRCSVGAVLHLDPLLRGSLADVAGMSAVAFVATVTSRCLR
jgi:hypothetical protein